MIGENHKALSGLRFLVDRVFVKYLDAHDLQLPVVFNLSIETGPVAGMAGAANLVHPDQESISVTVQPDGFHFLAVPGGFPLSPQFLSGT